MRLAESGRALARVGSICALFLTGCHRAATNEVPAPVPAAPAIAPPATAKGEVGKMGKREPDAPGLLTARRESEGGRGRAASGSIDSPPPAKKLAKLRGGDSLDHLLDGGRIAAGDGYGTGGLGLVGRGGGGGSGYGRGAGGLVGRGTTGVGTIRGSTIHYGAGGRGGSSPASTTSDGKPRYADATIPRRRDGDDSASGEGPRARMRENGVQAGEWDDNANFRDFQRYLKRQADDRAHKVDVSDRRILVVRDSDGKAVPDCRITIADGARKVGLISSPAGRALLFPHAEHLSGQTLTARAECHNASASATVAAHGDELTDLHLDTPRSLAAVRTLDVAFILDTTGSMSEEIAAVKRTLTRVAHDLDRQDLRVRVGLVEFRDRGDQYVTRVRPFSTDIAAFAKTIEEISANGGGDFPESVNAGVHVALHDLKWDETAVGRFAFLVGDAPPHLDYAQDFDYADEMKFAAHRGIEIFTVAASGMDDLGQTVWRQIAQYTGGTNLFILRGGAGPQSTGAGDPKSSCGDRQSNYTSGQLDELLVGVITRELRGLDGDPLRVPGLKEDERAKPCEERAERGASKG
jgi:hypothetical protein